MTQYTYEELLQTDKIDDDKITLISINVNKLTELTTNYENNITLIDNITSDNITRIQNIIKNITYLSKKNIQKILETKVELLNNYYNDIIIEALSVHYEIVKYNEIKQLMDIEIYLLNFILENFETKLTGELNSSILEQSSIETNTIISNYELKKKMFDTLINTSEKKTQYDIYYDNLKTLIKINNPPIISDDEYNFLFQTNTKTSSDLILFNTAEQHNKYYIKRRVEDILKKLKDNDNDIDNFIKELIAAKSILEKQTNVSELKINDISYNETNFLDNKYELILQPFTTQESDSNYVTLFENTLTNIANEIKLQYINGLLQKFKPSSQFDTYTDLFKYFKVNFDNNSFSPDDINELSKHIKEYNSTVDNLIETVNQTKVELNFYKYKIKTGPPSLLVSLSHTGPNNLTDFLKENDIKSVINFSNSIIFLKNNFTSFNLSEFKFIRLTQDEFINEVNTRYEIVKYEKLKHLVKLENNYIKYFTKYVNVDFELFNKLKQINLDIQQNINDTIKTLKENLYPGINELQIKEYNTNYAKLKKIKVFSDEQIEILFKNDIAKINFISRIFTPAFNFETIKNYTQRSVEVILKKLNDNNNDIDNFIRELNAAKSTLDKNVLELKINDISYNETNFLENKYELIKKPFNITEKEFYPFTTQESDSNYVTLFENTLTNIANEIKLQYINGLLQKFKPKSQFDTYTDLFKTKSQFDTYTDLFKYFKDNFDNNTFTSHDIYELNKHIKEYNSTVDNLIETVKEKRINDIKSFFKHDIDNIKKNVQDVLTFANYIFKLQHYIEITSTLIFNRKTQYLINKDEFVNEVNNQYEIIKYKKLKDLISQENDILNDFLSFIQQKLQVNYNNIIRRILKQVAKIIIKNNTNISNISETITKLHTKFTTDKKYEYNTIYNDMKRLINISNTGALYNVMFDQNNVLIEIKKGGRKTRKHRKPTNKKSLSRLRKTRRPFRIQSLPPPLPPRIRRNRKTRRKNCHKKQKSRKQLPPLAQ